MTASADARHAPEAHAPGADAPGAHAPGADGAEGDRPGVATRLGPLAALVALAWGTYWLALLRTMDYGGFPDRTDLGSGLRGFVLTFVCVLVLWVLPVALVLRLGRDRRRWIRRVVATCAASLLLALTWAGVEEARWRSRAPELARSSSDPGLRWYAGPIRIDMALSPETIFVQRWWPYTSHALYFDPASGRIGGYD